MIILYVTLSMILLTIFIDLVSTYRTGSKVKVVVRQNEQSMEEISAINSLLREQNGFNTEVNLPQLAVDVLDVYENNGIRIQSDIIEEVSFNNFNTHKEVFLFIESQRNNWKAESSKKLPKGMM